MTTQVLILPSMGDNTTLPPDNAMNSPSSLMGISARSATGGGPETTATIAGFVPIPNHNGNTGLFSGMASMAQQLNQHQEGSVAVSSASSSSGRLVAPKPASGKETGIVSHLRRNSSSGVRQDIESALKAQQGYKNSNNNAEVHGGLGSGNSIMNPSLTVSPGGNSGRGLAMLSGNTNLGTAMASNHFANMLLQGQLSRETGLSQQFSAMNGNGGMMMPNPNMLLAARLGLSNFGNFGNFGALSAAAGDPRLASAMFGGAAAPARKKRGPITLYMECDTDSLSEYQCLIRQQIELFEADKSEAASSVQGRNKQVIEGQVGIRCRHCANVPPRQRQKGSMYFPTKLDRIYQAAQNLSAFHLCENCKHVPDGIRKKILLLRERKSPAGGGKRYWGEGVRCLGVTEDHTGLRFR